MLLSRHLARHRIAAGEVPTRWQAAWPVVVDAIVLVAVLAAIFMPLMTTIYVMQPADGPTFAGLFLIYVAIPIWVIFVSLRWALRAREGVE